MDYDDYCYECTGYGDDYGWDEAEQEWKSNCIDCPFNEYNMREDD